MYALLKDRNMDIIKNIDSGLLTGIITSALFIIILIIVRFAIYRAIAHRNELTVEGRRRWRINVRNGILLLLIVGLVFIWANELTTFALSVVAIAVAFVIATKELILCLSGSILRAGSDMYRVGHRIEITGIRGDVVDYNLLTTTLLEIGPGKNNHQYTGRAIMFPNGILLTNSVVNETYMGEYVVDIVNIPLTLSDDVKKAESILLDAAYAECRQFIEEARSLMQKMEKEEWLDTPSVEPRVTIEYHDAGKINLLLRFPTPVKRKGRIQQAIIRRFIDSFHRTTQQP